MAKETTLILFKPDCVEKGLVGTVLARFEKDGFRIRGVKMIQLTQELLEEHYAHVVDRPFFPRLSSFMGRTPVIAMALEAENAIKRMRELMGPTDSKVAPPGTVRGDFGEDNTINILHASDSVENAGIEINRFFTEEEIFSY